jgi:hypothetical protein
MIPAGSTRDQSSELARSILRDWCRGDRHRFGSNLDRALKSIAETPAETSLQEERQDLLEGIPRELVQASAGSASASDPESITTCIALLMHLSSADEPPQGSVRAPG